MESEERDHLWDHFKFNADQRLKAFNFFVVLSAFADGWVLNAFEKQMSPFILLLVGGFIIILSIIFWLIDSRSKWLIDLAVPGLKAGEKQFSVDGQLFEIDERKGPKIARYTLAFRLLFGLQFLFGLGIVIYSRICSL